MCRVIALDLWTGEDREWTFDTVCDALSFIHFWTVKSATPMIRNTRLYTGKFARV